MDQRVFSAGEKKPVRSTITKAPEYDVSIILNLHNEARYLKRTMLSLEEAVRYARQFDITFEIVVVLDNADRRRPIDRANFLLGDAMEWLGADTAMRCAHMAQSGTKFRSRDQSQ